MTTYSPNTGIDYYINIADQVGGMEAGYHYFIVPTLCVGTDPATR